MTMLLLTLCSWPPQLPDLSPIVHLWNVVNDEVCIEDLELTNLQQRSDVIMSM